MADGLILADTSVLIDFFRKTDKTNTLLYNLAQRGYRFQISAVTEYEIYIGAAADQQDFWNRFLRTIPVLPLDHDAVLTAIEIGKTLKLQNKALDLADLFIAATAVVNNLPIATLNRKHFERVPALRILD